MAEIRVSDIPTLALPTIDEVFDSSSKRPRKLQYKSIVREVNVGKQTGTYVTIGTLSPAEDHVEGDQVKFDNIGEVNTTTIVSTTRDKGVKATLEALKYDLTGTVNRVFGEPLIRVMANKKERVVAALYNNAFTATGADGVAIIADNHPLDRNPALLNDNLLTGEMSTTTIAQAKNMFNFIYDQSGEFIGSTPTHLLIHPNKLGLALALLNSQLMAFELSNTKNTLQDYMPIKIVTNQYLTYNTTTDVSPWFMLDMSMDGAGAILQNFEELSLQRWFEPEDLSYRGVAYSIYGAGFVSPGYGIVGSAG